MDFQQSHGYMRPPPPPHPPPPAADPYQRPPPPVPPPPMNHPWPYAASQFQYQPQPQHSPSPPPQWPPPHSDHSQYPPPPPPPYPAHQPPPYPAHPHYPPTHPLPPRPPHHPQSFSQDWGSGSWSHHQSWQYPTNNNEEDWAAKARAWAAAKSATDSQHTPSQFVQSGRPEEQNHQYSQSTDPQFHDVHASLAPNYHQYPGAMGLQNRTGVGQLQDSQYVNTGQSSYTGDAHVPFAARNGSVAADSVPPFQQEKSPISPFFHQQEVPSSYSSVAGNVEAGDRYEKLNSSSSMPVPSLPQHHVHQLPPGDGRSGWMEEPHHLRGSQPAESVTDLSDQPLNFAPHFNREPEVHVQPNYTHPPGRPVRGGDPTAAVSSNYAWTPSSAPGVVYPPAPPTIPSGSQVDHPIPLPSPASGHSAPLFPHGHGFQPSVPMIGSAFGVGASGAPHPSFSGDFSITERPKKASVPNWLREEIIKNKAVIPSSTPELPKEDSQSIEDDNNDKSYRKGDQADSRSVESSRSTEDEDEDEDEVEAARTAAINKEIKRVLTEVLLKVTDELFDEIATKVLKEDELSVEVGQDIDLSNQKILPSVLTPKASAKILIPTITKESKFQDTSEKSNSGSAGDVLGLANYASDEEDDEIQSSGNPNSKTSSTHLQSSSTKLLEGNADENGGSPEGMEEQRNISAKSETTVSDRKSSVSATFGHSVAILESNDNLAAKDFVLADNQQSSKRLLGIPDNELQHGSDTSKLSSLTENAVERNERPGENLDAKKRMNEEDSRMRNTRDRSDRNDGIENNKNLVKRGRRESESSKGRVDKRGDEEHKRREEKRARTDRIDNHETSKEKEKEKGRMDEKGKNSESRKRPSPSDCKENVTETLRDKRASRKDNDERRKDRADEKKERSRHKTGNESSRHKRRRSSSIGARDRESKDNFVAGRVNDSSNESSDDSKRKSHHTKRRNSPSPRLRKRQVSRSPHSKHSKRRHSPYSSLETTRGRRSPSSSRSRSRSPVHRRR